MGIEVVGTRALGIRSLGDVARQLRARPGAHIAIASAYWDAHACATALELAARVGGHARLLLWTAGATRAAWIAAREAAADPALELRFIDSPAESGIFHAKLAGVVEGSSLWRCALVGSANLTAAGRATNVELGVLISDEPEALGQLGSWFELTWDAALPAELIDWDTAIAIAPERSEAAARKRIFAEAALAPQAPTVPLPAS